MHAVSTVNLEVDEQFPLKVSDAGSTSDLKSNEPTLHSVVSPPVLTVPGGRIFLDICSGVTRPLSKAVLHLGGDILSYDILLHSEMDLLRDDSYEQLLRLCSSGQVGYGSASPACAHYSRLKLLPGPGPKALRTPEALQGVKGLSGYELQQVQESYLMLSRCIICLTLIFQAGGHVHLEQPPSAMSWLEECVRQFLKLISAWCVVISACAYGKDWYKTWMFASSYQAICDLGALCNHPPHSHESMRGLDETSGEFRSRQTACYPEDLAQKFATIILPLVSHNAQDWAWKDRHALLPIKGRCDPPISYEDGAGLWSLPDWSLPGREDPDTFQSMRQAWVQKILESRLDKQLLLYFSQDVHAAPPFSDEVIQPFRNLLIEFFTQQGISLDWTVREHQPMHLMILQAFGLVMKDRDTTLFPSLINGVMTGFRNNIPVSGCMPVNDREANQDIPLSVHYTNWNSAESDMDLTQTLVQDEIDKGWVFEFTGTLEDAQARWPAGVSLGKLGIAHSEGRAPRLVLDNTICGLNPRCFVPERSTLPTCKDVLRTFPLRDFQGDHMAFSLDIKAAHKRIVLHSEEQGLVGFTMNQRLFFYRVTPFGAVFSAHWWARLGGFLLRIFHRLIWWAHTGLLYVDDYFFTQCKDMMPMSATLVCILCQICGIPISWGKCELGGTIQWIGWTFHMTAGYIEIPQQKLSKLLTYILEMKRSSRTTRRHLEKLIGLAMWITQLWPYMRIWIRHWYQDLYTVPLTHFSIDYGDWHFLVESLNDDLTFRHRPQGTAIPIGGTLMSVRHQGVSCLADLQSLRLSEKRIWMRIKDPHSKRRTLSEASLRILEIFETWLKALSPLRPLTPKVYWQGSAAADACAAGSKCQIGGFLQQGETKHWFCEHFTVSDFENLGLRVSQDLQRHITCFEALAQIALLFIASRIFPAHRFPLCLKTLSDNTGAESGSNKLWSMSYPLCVFLEKLCLLSGATGMEIDVSHIPGSDNIIADDLSRWDGIQPIPHSFTPSERFRLDLHSIWNIRQSPSLVPCEAKIPWTLPR